MLGVKTDRMGSGQGNLFPAFADSVVMQGAYFHLIRRRM